MKKLCCLTALLLAAATPTTSSAFCGFYATHAGSQIYNQASKVVLVRKDEQTVLTMINDFQGDAKDFAMVVPVPSVLQKQDIRLADPTVIDRLDAYTAPRLTKFYDGNPCHMNMDDGSSSNTQGLGAVGTFSRLASDERDADAVLGVHIEAVHTVGEYDILILSAKQSDGLTIWLKENGYAVSDTAAEVLGSYIKQNMLFFVAKINLARLDKTAADRQFLRPLQISFNTAKFMLPIRLGMTNAKDSQELFILALTAKGAVETVNYPTRKIPTKQKVPGFVEENFTDFYKRLFDHQLAEQNYQAVFMEYANDIKSCDPCVASPPSDKDLQALGVFWQKADKKSPTTPLFLTRLHLRYDQAHFPEDLLFQETAGRPRFQANFSVTIPYGGRDMYENYVKKGVYGCTLAYTYFNFTLPLRQEEEAGSLSALTGEDINGIRAKMGLPGEAPEPKKIWQLLDKL